MLNRTPEFGDQESPIVSICIIGNKHSCPPNFLPILKAHDDGEADLWKESGVFGIFGRNIRYIAVSRIVPENTQHEVITDLAIITEKEAVPTNFICIDYTADSKERALRKKFLCVRFTQRNDAIDALTDIIVLNKSKRPPKGYASAGEVDGTLICFKVATIPHAYGIKQNVVPYSPVSQLYPSTSTSRNAPIVPLHSPPKNSFGTHQGLDGVPFKLNPRFEAKFFPRQNSQVITNDPSLNYDLSTFEYNFRLERSILAQN